MLGQFLVLDSAPLPTNWGAVLVASDHRFRTMSAWSQSSTSGLIEGGPTLADDMFWVFLQCKYEAYLRLTGADGKTSVPVVLHHCGSGLRTLDSVP